MWRRKHNGRNIRNGRKRTFAIVRGIRKYEESLKRTRKRNVTLYVDAELVNKARSLGINLSTLTESVLRVYIPEVRKKKSR